MSVQRPSEQINAATAEVRLLNEQRRIVQSEHYRVVQANAYRVVQAWLAVRDSRRCPARDLAVSGFRCELPSGHDGSHCADAGLMSTREWMP